MLFSTMCIVKNRYVFLKNQYMKIVTRKKNNILFFYCTLIKTKGVTIEQQKTECK